MQTNFALSAAIVLTSHLRPAVLVVNPIFSGESHYHQRAKQRLYDLIAATGPRIIQMEYVYGNPFNPEYPWKFDVYAELHDGRKIAIEVDGKIGHTSKRSHEKREAKKQYLADRGIELYAFPTKWVISRKQLPDSLFLEEMHLT
jgi:hypothetical protein